MKVIGISCFYHDSAVALIEDGEVIAAVQEERFTRKKHDPNFPFNALNWVLSNNGIQVNEIDAMIYYEDVKKKLNRVKDTYLIDWPNSLGAYIKSMESQNAKQDAEHIIREVFKYDGLYVENNHHRSHAASAFYPSPFEDAAVLTMDGVGEWDATTYGVGRCKDLIITKTITYPDSIGMLYSLITHYCGFKVNSGEYKLMGLAPYGRPVYFDLIKNTMIEIKQDGSYKLNQDVFRWFKQADLATRNIERIFGRNKREAESEKIGFYSDVAASIQKVTEEVVLNIARHIRKETGETNLCMAGGVALNCVANGKLIKERLFDEVWVQPAAGDAGNAIGAALDYYYKNAKYAKRKVKETFSPYLGPSYTNEEIRSWLDSEGINYLMVEKVEEKTAQLLSEGKVIGWFQGASEFGPRALGNRSIIADPRSGEMQRDLNLKIKFRESFRPFAPSVLEEDVNEWFDINQRSPYMLFVGEVTKEKRLEIKQHEESLAGIDRLNVKTTEIPAVTHVDYTARVQTVRRSENIKYYELISEFKKITGCPVLVNTSFNVRGEPIVMKPEDAYRCFMRTDMDCLVMGNHIMYKEEQPAYHIDDNWMDEFELD